MEDIIILDGFAIAILLYGRVLENKWILIFSGVIILLVGFQIMLDGDFQYVSAIVQHNAETQTAVFNDTINTTVTTISANLSEVKTYTSLTFLGLNGFLVIALTHLAVGMVTMLKPVLKD